MLFQGIPTLEEMNHDTCVAVFSWPTYLVCSTSTQPDVDNDCLFTDGRRDYVFDFNDLKQGPGQAGYTVSIMGCPGTGAGGLYCEYYGMSRDRGGRVIL